MRAAPVFFDASLPKKVPFAMKKALICVALVLVLAAAAVVVLKANPTLLSAEPASRVSRVLPFLPQNPSFFILIDLEHLRKNALGARVLDLLNREMAEDDEAPASFQMFNPDKKASVFSLWSDFSDKLPRDHSCIVIDLPVDTEAVLQKNKAKGKEVKQRKEGEETIYSIDEADFIKKDEFFWGCRGSMKDRLLHQPAAQPIADPELAALLKKAPDRMVTMMISSKAMLKSLLPSTEIPLSPEPIQSISIWTNDEKDSIVTDFKIRFANEEAAKAALDQLNSALDALFLSQGALLLNLKRTDATLEQIGADLHLTFTLSELSIRTIVAFTQLLLKDAPQKDSDSPSKDDLSAPQVSVEANENPVQADAE